MTKLQKMIAVLAGAAGFAVLDCFAVPVSGSDLNDGDTIFHLPFDGSMDSVSVKTFSSAGGGISYPSDGIAGVNVIDRSPVRVNGNCMKLDRSVAFVDVTDFGFDGQITSVTVEFHIKGESTGFQMQNTGRSLWESWKERSLICNWVQRPQASLLRFWFRSIQL